MGTKPDAEENIDSFFTEIVNNYQTMLLRICLLQLQDYHLAEDAVQETFYKAYRALYAWKHDCSVKTWLFRIAINTCRDIHRSSWWIHRKKSMPIDSIISLSYCNAEQTNLTQAIASLPYKSKEVIILYYYQGLDEKEIASILHLAPSTVSSRLCSSRKKLKKLIKEEY